MMLTEVSPEVGLLSRDTFHHYSSKANIKRSEKGKNDIPALHWMEQSDQQTHFKENLTTLNRQPG